MNQSQRRFNRVLTIARMDSVSVMVCSGFSALLAYSASQWVFAGFATLAFGAGMISAQARTRLKQTDFGGFKWLSAAQLYLLTVIVGYLLWRWRNFDPQAIWDVLPAENQREMESQMRAAGLDPLKERDLLLRTANFVICAIFGFLSFLYQGGLAFWYNRQRMAVAEVLGLTREDSPLDAPPPAH